jgi:Ca-activated chloride channel homolog
MNNRKTPYSVRQLINLLFIAEGVFGVLTFIFFFAIGVFSHTEGEEGLHFLKPDYFYLFGLLLPLGYLFIKSVERKNLFLKHLSFFTFGQIEKPGISLIFIRFFLVRTAFVFLIFALAQPVFGKKKVSGNVKTMELVICLDVSNSMNANDIDNTPRIEVAKRALLALANRFTGEKVGLCVFAGDAFMQLPLTTDYAALKLFISEMSTDFVSKQGTNIPEAIKVARSMFSKQNLAKAIFIVTDGENHEKEEETTVYKDIVKEQIQVCILGIGTEKGGNIPVVTNFGDVGLLKDQNGKVVLTRLNPTFIQYIAQKTNGTALLSSEAYPDIEILLTQINRMKRVKIRNLEFETEESRYQYPLSVAVFCWLLWLLFPLTKKNKKNAL